MLSPLKLTPAADTGRTHGPDPIPSVTESHPYLTVQETVEKGDEETLESNKVDTLIFGCLVVGDIHHFQTNLT
jgi:hypothetical protein